MQTADALERIAYELAEDLAAENVRYAEIRYSPILNTREGLPLTEAVEAPLRGCGGRRRGVRHPHGADHLRHPQHGAGDLARPGGPHRGLQEPRRGGLRPGGRRVQLPGQEAQGRLLHRHQQEHGGHDPRGEAYGPESIHQALHYCQAHRIGHGTRLFEDPDLMQYVKDFRIPIEICLTSNVQTRAVEQLRESTRCGRTTTRGWCSA
jgi:adenosine deaminase